jgi:hypothetical protein
VRILLSFESFDSFAGTETYTLTVAQQFEALGHQVAIYAANQGAIAAFARRQGVRVLSRDELPRGCDLVVFGDAATCHELAPLYGDAVRLFVAHSTHYDFQSPPQLAGRCDAVIVLNDRVRRAVEARGSHAPIVRLRQPIDTPRFRNIGESRSRAQRALVFSNYIAGHRAELIERACRANGIDVSWVGATTSPSATPEHAIANADLVIAIGRSALEGMASGRAVYVYGAVGGDGWVTPEHYPAMEADGFAGLSVRKLVIDPDRLAEDLASWDQLMGAVNRDLVFAHHDAREHAIELVRLARDLGCPRASEATAADELAHLVRRAWEALARRNAALLEAANLRAQLEAVQAQLATLSSEAADAYTQLDDLRRSRRYRLACLIASPLDRMRARRGDRRS